MDKIEIMCKIFHLTAMIAVSITAAILPFFFIANPYPETYFDPEASIPFETLW